LWINDDRVSKTLTVCITITELADTLRGGSSISLRRAHEIAAQTAKVRVGCAAKLWRAAASHSTSFRDVVGQTSQMAAFTRLLPGPLRTSS
jgi:argininosuccinate lyase